MSRAALRILAVSVALTAFFACGDSQNTPAGPNMPVQQGGGNSQGGGATPAPSGAPIAAGSRVLILSGENQRPVAGARFIVDGKETVAGADGSLALDRALPTGTAIEILAEGFLDRHTVLREDLRYTLWPRESPTHLNEDFTERIVYTSAVDNTTAVPLYHPPNGTTRIAVVPDEVLAGAPLFMGLLPGVLTEMSDATGITYALSNEGGSGSIRMEIEPKHGDDSNCANFWAYTYGARDGSGGGRIVFCYDQFHPESAQAFQKTRGDEYATQVFQNLALHEVAHTFGLRHFYEKDGTGGVMSDLETIRFSDRERLAIKLMLLRPPGNRFPDTDAALGTRRAPAAGPGDAP